ncbi:hypothetical protein [Winogradskyella sp.]|uniref:hypothetical protein n=1 Tax=Winogradskyella sp. TaxID=1883156 RepID=UPI003BAB683E
MRTKSLVALLGLGWLTLYFACQHDVLPHESQSTTDVPRITTIDFDGPDATFNALKSQYHLEAFRAPHSSRRIKGKSTTDTLGLTIATDIIRQVTLGDYSSYTMKIVHDKDSTVFYNLTIEYKNGASDIFITKYSPTAYWLNNTNETYQGEVQSRRATLEDYSDPDDAFNEEPGSGPGNPDLGAGPGGGSGVNYSADYPWDCMGTVIVSTELIPYQCTCEHHWPWDACDCSDQPGYDQVVVYACEENWDADPSDPGDTSNPGGGSADPIPDDPAITVTITPEECTERIDGDLDHDCDVDTVDCELAGNGPEVCDCVSTGSLVDECSTLMDCVGTEHSATLLQMSREVRTAMANYINTNGCSTETTQTINTLVNYLIEGQITDKEIQLTLATLSNDTPWTTASGSYNGVSAITYYEKRTINLGGRQHFQYKLINGDDIFSVSNYPLGNGSGETAQVFFYFSQATQKWYDFQEPSSYSPLTLDFLWDGFWSATETAIRVATPLEDVIILIEGKDFHGVEQSRAVAAGWILVDIIPGSAAIKGLKLIKYGDEVVQLAEAVIKYVDDIYTAQRQNIEAVLDGFLDLDHFGNTIRKGNFGEMVTDTDLYSKGYEPLHVRRTDIDEPLNQGIDGVFKNPQTGEYIIVESKYNTSQLGTTFDGRQMSDDWIQGAVTGFDRLGQEVGEELAEDIYAEGYTRVLAQVLPDGSISYKELDNAGYVMEPWIP